MSKKDEGKEQDIRKAVKARAAKEAAEITAEAKDEGLTSARVMAAYYDNERGDGELFAETQKEKFFYNATTQCWYFWVGHHWQRDILNAHMGGVRAVAEIYLSEVKNLKNKAKIAKEKGQTDTEEELQDQIKGLRRRVNRLNSVRGAKSCLEWARSAINRLGVKEENLDAKPSLLALTNGVIELKTGWFRSGRPDDLMTKAVPHEWQGFETPAPIWEKFLMEVFDGDVALVAYIRRLFGYSIMGESSEHILPILHGVGRNGKGVLVETLKYALGPLCHPIQSEMLLEQRFGRSSSGPSPDIMALKGLLIAFASETDEGRRYSTSRAKWLSGGDTLVGRNPHDKFETSFRPTHTLCLLTNHLPHAAGDDFSFWQRVHLIPFRIKFVDRPQGEDERLCDKSIPFKLRAEAPGILAWLVRGCLEWQRDGLAPPRAVLAATERYRFNEDTIAEFLEACCYPPEKTTGDSRVKFGEAYSAFEGWFLKNCGNHPPKKKKFGLLMEKRFKKQRVGGYIYFYGLTLRPEWECVE